MPSRTAQQSQHWPRERREAAAGVAPAVMQIMGWSDASVAKRYMHVPNEFAAAIAAQVGGLIWADPSDEAGAEDDGPRGSLVPA